MMVISQMPHGKMVAAEKRFREIVEEIHALEREFIEYNSYGRLAGAASELEQLRREIYP